MSATAQDDIKSFLRPSAADRVQGRMYGFATQFSVPAGDYMLRGEVVFPRGVELPLRTKRLYRAQVVIRRREVSAPKPKPVDDSESWPFPDPGSLADQLTVTQGNESLPYGQLYLQLDDKNWDSLARGLGPDGFIDFSGTLKPFVSEPTNCAFELKLHKALQVTVRASAEGPELKGARYQELEDAFLRFALSGGQVQLIAREIAESASTTALTRQEALSLIEKVGNLLADLRSAMRPHEPAPGEQFGTIWLLRPDEFEQLLGKYDAEQQKTLRARYDMVWLHYDSMLAMTEGEKKYGAPKDGFQPKADELEEVVRQYLALPAGRSRFLEWVLVDALLYCECIAFAQTVLSEKTFLGMKVASELTGVSTSLKRSAKELGKLALRGVGELVVIALTFLGASVLTAQDSQSAWVVTTGVTAARWIRKAIVLTHAKTPEQIQYQLLRDMSSVQRAVTKVPDFSASHLMDQLNRLSEKGAVFSPLVYRLLDDGLRSTTERRQ